MRIVHAVHDGVIPIGRLGENEATAVVFDVSHYRELFGEGTFTLLHQRNGDELPYPCVTTTDEGSVTWPVKSADVAVQGYGRCELIYTVGGTVAKSVIFSTLVGEALTGGAEPPEPWEDWVQEVINASIAAHEAQDAAEEAQSKAETAQDAAETAQGKAEDAQEAAEEAQTGSEAAQTAASAAQAAAEAAASVALASATDAAQSAADAATAQGKAEDAQSAAERAKNLAASAKAAAELAASAAETAQTAAEEAQSKSEDAQTAAEDARDATLAALGDYRTAADQDAIDATKADKTALAYTDKRLKYLYELTQGQAWDTDEDSTEAYSKAVPAGAKAVTQQMIGGKSVVWNQLTKNGDFSDGIKSWQNPYSVDFSAENGIATLTVKSGTVGGRFCLIAPCDVISGHRYLIRLKYKYLVSASTRLNAQMTSNGVNLSAAQHIVTQADGEWHDFGVILTATAGHARDYNTGVIIRFDTITALHVGDSVQFKDAMTIDVTQMFGSSIADTITTPQKAYALGCPKEYVAYNLGEIVSADVTALESRKADTTLLDTLTIPTAVRALEGYGQSEVGGNGNTVDFERKVYTEIGHYVDDVWTTLAAPVETDISALLPDDLLIDAEGGGALTFVQTEIELPVPNKETFFINLSESVGGA